MQSVECSSVSSPPVLETVRSFSGVFSDDIADDDAWNLRTLSRIQMEITIQK